MPEPWRTRLIDYLEDVRDAGFERLTISFAPRLANNPGRAFYDPRRLPENWAFIRDVRALAYAYGPPSIHIDLLNEGPPSDREAPRIRRQRMTYLTTLYRRYVQRYGTGDVTISVNAGRYPPTRPGSRRSCRSSDEAASRRRPGSRCTRATTAGARCRACAPSIASFMRTACSSRW